MEKDFMDVMELVQKLLEKPKELINLALVRLMLEDKIGFVDVSNAYTKALEAYNEDSLNKLIEAETCVMESFIYKKGKSKKDSNHTQRCLYLLNKSKRFQVKDLNEKYAYDEAYGKSMSWYERNKSLAE